MSVRRSLKRSSFQTGESHQHRAKVMPGLFQTCLKCIWDAFIPLYWLLPVSGSLWSCKPNGAPPSTPSHLCSDNSLRLCLFFPNIHHLQFVFKILPSSHLRQIWYLISLQLIHLWHCWLFAAPPPFSVVLLIWLHTIVVIFLWLSLEPPPSLHCFQMEKWINSVWVNKWLFICEPGHC